MKIQVLILINGHECKMNAYDYMTRWHMYETPQELLAFYIITVF